MNIQHNDIVISENIKTELENIKIELENIKIELNNENTDSISKICNKLDNILYYISVYENLQDKVKQMVKLETNYLSQEKKTNDEELDDKNKFLMPYYILNNNNKSSLYDFIKMMKSNKEEQKNKQSKDKIKKIYLNKIYDVNLDNNFLELECVKNISDIKPSLYWFEGDNSRQPGIYTCIIEGFYIKVPFPDAVSYNKNIAHKTIKCIHSTKENCLNVFIKKNYKRDPNEYKCNFVHRKEQFNKIIYNNKFNIKSFGSHKNLNRDLSLITLMDIKHMLMYSLSDNLLAALWFQNIFPNKNLILSNIDIY